MTINSQRFEECGLTDWMKLLPSAPYESRTKLPSLLVNRRHTWKMRETLNRIHLAGIVALHGPIPREVLIQSISLSRGPDIPNEPRLLATMFGKDEWARYWLEAFEHGLEAWHEAGFDEPVDMMRYDQDGMEGFIFSVADYEPYIQRSLSSLAVAGRQREMNNLRKHRF